MVHWYRHTVWIIALEYSCISLTQAIVYLPGQGRNASYPVVLLALHPQRCLRSPSLPLLHQLHWLPIESRICYKLCSLMYRVNHKTAPSYLSELCVPCSDTRLRSTTRGNYMIPRTHRHLANRAFAVAAPSSWNSLPNNVRDYESYSNFLSKLKTHYFNIAFYNHIIC